MKKAEKCPLKRLTVSLHSYASSTDCTYYIAQGPGFIDITWYTEAVSGQVADVTYTTRKSEKQLMEVSQHWCLAGS